MRTIHKARLEVTDSQTLMLPAEAKLLTVQVQHGAPCLWYECESTNPPDPRVILTFGTGHEIPADLNLAYLGTYQVSGGQLIFHAFERHAK